MKSLPYKPVYRLVDRRSMPPKPRPDPHGPASIGAFEAKTRFGELLARVLESGEPLTITRRGTPVAKLVPIQSEVRDAAHLASRFRAFQDAHALEGLTTRELVDEGRR
jgi:prevent-host-death family protein